MNSSGADPGAAGRERRVARASGTPDDAQFEPRDPDHPASDQHPTDSAQHQAESVQRRPEPQQPTGEQLTTALPRHQPPPVSGAQPYARPPAQGSQGQAPQRQGQQGPAPQGTGQQGQPYPAPPYQQPYAQQPYQPQGHPSQPYQGQQLPPYQSAPHQGAPYQPQPPSYQGQQGPAPHYPPAQPYLPQGPHYGVPGSERASRPDDPRGGDRRPPRDHREPDQQDHVGDEGGYRAPGRRGQDDYDDRAPRRDRGDSGYGYDDRDASYDDRARYRGRPGGRPRPRGRDHGFADRGQDGYGPNDHDPNDYEPNDYSSNDYSFGDHGHDGYDDRDYGDSFPDYDDPQDRPRGRTEREPGQRGSSQRGSSQRDRSDRSGGRPPARGSHLPPYSEPLADPGPAVATPTTGPRKLTVTRVAALRSKELTNRGVQLFHRATTADGADRSGLTHLTYAVMANYAVDAALAVALANTLFFAAATGESPSKVLLYLLITVAPFAVIAPLVGPMLDRLQNGRRVALAVSSFARALLALVMAFNFDSWALYPCALGMMVLSKSFGVLKAALTPRVLPEEITLVKTNSRLTVFGLMAGGVAGAIAAGLAALFDSPGALVFTAVCGVVGGILCLKIPAWVESTEGEVPVHQLEQPGRRRAFPSVVTTTLWANGTIRVETGFLALFIAFVVKREHPDVGGFNQLLLLGIVGVAAGLGGFLGNALGARLPLNHPELTALIGLSTVVVATLVAFLAPGLATAAVVGLIGSTASSLAKVCLDSVIQHHLPEASRASAFGRSESVLQLCWVFGGVIGLLLGGVWTFGKSISVYAIGFGVITLLLILGLVQCWLVRAGRTMLPAFPSLRRSRTSEASTGPIAMGPTGTAVQPAAPAQQPLAPPTTSTSAKRPPRKAGRPR